MSKRTVMSLMIAGVAVLMVAALFIINRTTIFQEGNPVPVVKGIYAIVVKKEPYGKIKDDPPVYITRADRDAADGGSQHERLFLFLETKYGVQFDRQENEGKYVFSGNGKTLAVYTRRYSRDFQVWQVEGP